MARRDRRLKRDKGSVESRLRSRLGSRMIWPNDVAVCLLPISLGGGADGRAVVVCCNSLLGEPGEARVQNGCDDCANDRG
jgi:hypothetical protein